MKQLLLSLLIVGVGITLSGCSGSRKNLDRGSFYSAQPESFQASSIDIVALTEISMISSYDNISKIRVYIDVFDSYNSKIKFPGFFRFELFEFQPRSADPKGNRIFFWKDQDLTDPQTNCRFWRDALRSYEFDLTLDRALNKSSRYVLLVTCTTVSGERLTDQRIIKYRSR